MRVLVTGGAGFIGGHVLPQLLAHGHDVIVLDRRPTRPLSGVKAVVGDVRDETIMDAALTGADAVCHLAAVVGLGVDVQDTPDYADTNVRGTAVVLAAMARAGIHRFVQASSMVVYGEGLGRCAEHGLVAPGARAERELISGNFEPPCPTCGRPLSPATVDENVRLEPRNAYAASKVAQEHFASSWAHATGSSALSLRYHNVYGPGMPRDTPYAGVAAIFRSALLRGEPPRVFEDGGQRRDFVHVRDVASATVAALEHHEHGTLALNVGTGIPRTVGDLATALADAVDGPRPSITGEYRLGDVRHITADSTRLRDMFGWQPREPFTTGVAELIA
jgi:dTDP-L-rhamnose 4-epimerase